MYFLLKGTLEQATFSFSISQPEDNLVLWVMGDLYRGFATQVPTDWEDENAVRDSQSVVAPGCPVEERYSQQAQLVVYEAFS